jgi:hypothetical protein
MPSQSFQNSQALGQFFYPLYEHKHEHARPRNHQSHPHPTSSSSLTASTSTRVHRCHLHALTNHGARVWLQPQPRRKRRQRPMMGVTTKHVTPIQPTLFVRLHPATVTTTSQHSGHQRWATILLPPADCANTNTNIKITRARAILWARVGVMSGGAVDNVKAEWLDIRSCCRVSVVSHKEGLGTSPYCIYFVDAVL